LSITAQTMPASIDWPAIRVTQASLSAILTDR